MQNASMESLLCLMDQVCSLCITVHGDKRVHFGRARVHAYCKGKIVLRKMPSFFRAIFGGIVPRVVHNQLEVALQLSVLWFLEIRPLFGRTVWANKTESYRASPT